MFTLESAYRPQKRQNGLAAESRGKHGANARTWVAEKSEHITGRAFDLNLGIKNSSENAEAGAFNGLASYQWLQANAWRYGLNPYTQEPWHWSFTANYNDGISIE